MYSLLLVLVFSSMFTLCSCVLEMVVPILLLILDLWVFCPVRGLGMNTYRA